MSGDDMYNNAIIKSNKDKIIQRLSEELSITRLALAQVVCNSERQYGFVTWREMADIWIGYAALMPKWEWLAGRDAILHFLRLHGTKDSIAAIELLNSHEASYEQNKKICKSVYRQKGGKSVDTYSRGVDMLMKEIAVHTHSNPDLHGASMGAYMKLKSFISECKSSMTKVSKWLIKAN
jgi:hypothetical protein